jgi:hypothetical protein
MRLILNHLSARLCVTVHDEVSKLMRNVESLPIIVALDRIQYHNRPKVTVE